MMPTTGFYVTAELKIKVRSLLQEHAVDFNKLQSFETLERYKVIQEILSHAVRQEKNIGKSSVTSSAVGSSSCVDRDG